MSNAPNSRPGAVPVGKRPARRKWLLPLLLGLLALIALLLLLTQCGGDDDATSQTSGTPASPATAGTTSSAPAPASATASAAASGPAGAAQGAVTADGTDLLGAAVNFGEHDGEQAVGDAAPVQSVPADEGFWVGTGEQDRLWVQLTGTRGESDYKVKEGDTVDFTGTVTRAPQGFAAETGVSQAEGADQLTEQGYYVSVPASGVKLSR